MEGMDSPPPPPPPVLQREPSAYRVKTHVRGKLLATTSTLLPLEHEDHSVLSAIYAFRDPIDFSFVYILQLGDDLWPHSQEGSEKPITKDFQFSHLM